MAEQLGGLGGLGGVDPRADYIQGLYRDLLGREADAGGLNYWMNSGLDEFGLYDAINTSPESQAQFYQINYLDPIRHLYQTALGREADQDGLDYWAKQYSGEMGWEEVARAIAASPEAQARHFGMDTNSIFNTVMREMGYFSPTFVSDQPNARVDGRLSSFADLPSLSDADKLRLARTLYGEGRGETNPDGLAAIMHVLRNRFATNRVGSQDGVPFMTPWGNTIDELTNENEFSTWKRGQAGTAERNNYNAMMAFGPGHPDWQKYMDLIEGVWSGAIPDPTGGAMSYYSTGIRPPPWATQLAPYGDITIGNHRFLGKTPLLGPGAVRGTPPGFLTDPYNNPDGGYNPGPGSSYQGQSIDPMTGQWFDPGSQSIYGFLQPGTGIAGSTMMSSALENVFQPYTIASSSGVQNNYGTGVNYLSDPGGQTGGWGTSLDPYGPFLSPGTFNYSSEAVW